MSRSAVDSLQDDNLPPSGGLAAWQATRHFVQRGERLVPHAVRQAAAAGIRCATGDPRCPCRPSGNAVLPLTSQPAATRIRCVELAVARPLPGPSGGGVLPGGASGASAAQARGRGQSDLPGLSGAGPVSLACPLRPRAVRHLGSDDSPGACHQAERRTLDPQYLEPADRLFHRLVAFAESKAHQVIPQIGVRSLGVAEG